MMLVIYANLSDDKEKGLLLNGYHFGGVAANQEQADEIAKKCVDDYQGRIIIPKIIPVEHEYLVDNIIVAVSSLRLIVDDMMEMSGIIDKQ